MFGAPMDSFGEQPTHLFKCWKFSFNLLAANETNNAGIRPKGVFHQAGRIGAGQAHRILADAGSQMPHVSFHKIHPDTARDFKLVWIARFKPATAPLDFTPFRYSDT
jgi:hypothetical protein